MADKSPWHRECLNCTFWNPVEHEVGECRVRAPRIIATQEGIDRGGGLGFRLVARTKTGFPIVKASDWCGEFVPIPKEGP